MIIPNKFNGYMPDGRRLYFKKGGSSGTKEMQQMEADRQRRIQQAVDVINNIFDPSPYQKGVNVATSFDPSQTYYNADGSRYAMSSVGKGGGNQNSNSSGNIMQSINDGFSQMFGQQQPDYTAAQNALANGQLYTGVETINPESREKLYREQKDAVYDINAKEVTRQLENAERANRFGLARNGLLGGSADIDSNATLQEKTNEGLVQSAAAGDAAAASLRQQDERAKQSLIAMAQSGIDTGTAQQSALAALNATEQSALGERGASSLGNLFGDLSQAYLQNQYMKGSQNGWMYGSQYPNMSTQKTYGGNQS